MHCNICDKQLSEKEINWNEELDAWEPCSVCLDVAMDAAYSEGFLTEDDEYVLIEDDDEQYASLVWAPYDTGDEAYD